MKLSLTYPLKSVLIHQSFGANPQMYSDPKYGGIKGHNGIDFFAGHGTFVYATHDGFAHYEIDDGQGHGVVIVSDKTYDYKGQQVYFKSIYWHLCDSSKEPQFKSPVEGHDLLKVRTGDLIGYADNTGASTGDHLHFGLKPCLKMPNGSYENIETLNGYLGAINPAPYFTATPETIAIMEKEIPLLQKLIDLYRKLLTFRSGR